jgi:hypothetical protein
VEQNRAYVSLTHICLYEEHLKLGDVHRVQEFLIVGHNKIPRPKNIKQSKIQPA